jgi:peptidoglycan/LPS O-acetylase OafA/YrhL
MIITFEESLNRFSDRWSTVLPSVASIATITSLSVLLPLCGLAPPRIREVLISGGAAPLLASILLTFSHPKSFGSRFLGSNMLFEAGAVSYITYILQAPAWHILRLAMGGTRSATAGSPIADWQLGVYLALLLALSFVVQQTVEGQLSGCCLLT